MEKHTYIKPEAIEVLFECESMLAESQTKVGVSNSTTGEDAYMSNRRRGSWGSLWN